jgi:hypothetical protein
LKRACSGTCRRAAPTPPAPVCTTTPAITVGALRSELADSMMSYVIVRVSGAIVVVRPDR